MLMWGLAGKVRGLGVVVGELCAPWGAFAAQSFRECISMCLLGTWILALGLNV